MKLSFATSPKKSATQHDLMIFQLRKEARATTIEDHFFPLGQQVYKSKVEWPIGVAFSQPATFSDLREKLLELSKFHKKQR